MSQLLPQIDWPALTNLPAEQVEAHRRLLVDQLRRRWPEIDWDGGVIQTLIAHLHAILTTQQASALAEVWRFRSPASLAEEAASVPDAWVDALLSNYRIQRRPARKATGTIQVVVRQNLPLVIAQGNVWVVGGERFVVPQAITAALPDEIPLVGATSALEPTADGFWAFRLPLVAEAAGTTSQLRAQLPAQPLQPPLGFVRAHATGDFIPGRLRESNREILQRLRDGITAQVPASRAHWQSFLRQALEPELVPVAISLVGFGDSEQVRDRRSVLGISTGGKVDAYVRTQRSLRRRRWQQEATLVSRDTLGYGIYQLTLERQQASGLYVVESVRPVGQQATGSLRILEEVRQVDTTPPERPDVQTPDEAAYSSYQTITLRWLDDTVNADTLPLGSQRPFELEALGLDGIDRLQEVVNQRQHRLLGGDCLVKAPMPCWVRVHLRITHDPADPIPATELIRASVEQAIEQTGFTGALFAGQIHEAVLPYLHGQMKLSVLDLQGRLRYPDGRWRYVRDHDCLRVPEGEHPLVSARTVQFFPDSPSVQIDLVLQAV